MVLFYLNHYFNNYFILILFIFELFHILVNISRCAIDQLTVVTSEARDTILKTLILISVNMIF